MSRATPVSGHPGIRRRRSSSTQREKTSISIRADVLEAARVIVKAGEAENLSALIEEALEEKVKRTRRAALYEAYAEAAGDEAFADDMGSVSRAFDHAVGDGLK